MYLLDTCVVSEARRRTPEAVAWLRAARSETLFLSAITVGEIMKGITMKGRTHPHQAAVLLRWLDELRFVYSGRILPVDDAVATGWGRLMAQPTRPVADSLIAATARTFNKMVVTRNIGDFADMGVDLIDPWRWRSSGTWNVDRSTSWPPVRRLKAGAAR
jgi:predicted nucleic acid-binding protein